MEIFPPPKKKERKSFTVEERETALGPLDVGLWPAAGSGGAGRLDSERPRSVRQGAQCGLRAPRGVAGHYPRSQQKGYCGSLPPSSGFLPVLPDCFPHSRWSDP